MMIMRRYHFDLIDTNSVTDLNGALLDDDDQARKVGHELVQEVREQRPELVGQGYEVLVRNETGEEILRAAVDQFPTEGNGH
jgi:hypothetical protein